MVLQLLNDTLPLYDWICKRSLSFASKCFTSEANLVRYVACCGVFHGHMSSTLGRNVQHCCTCYSVFLYENNCSAIDRVCKNRYTQDDYARALFVMELIMLKLDILHISDEFFSVQDNGTVINFVCSF